MCDPALTGLLVHEIVGHMLEADVTASDVELMLRLKLGTPIAWEGLCLVDDPGAEGEGHYVYDDEGTRGHRVTLIQHGRVAGHLHSRATAGALGAEPTGHAQACGYDMAPLVRMSNTFVLPGNEDPQTLVGNIQKGIYAAGTRGAIGGRYLALHPQETYLIENGRITKPIRGMRLCGDAFECLRHVDGIGRDFQLLSGGCGGCYKDGQGPLRTSSGGPHIRLRGMMVR